MEAGHDLAAFVKVADRGGFSAAAEDLGLTPSALSKLVSRLEERLGARLFARSTRKVSLTPEGEVYLAHCRDILAAMEAADAEISAAGGRPQGVVRVNVGSAFARHQLDSFVPDFCARYPDVHLDIAVTDRLIDVLTEGVDVAIRTGTLSDSRLVARKIGESRRYICASPDYLARNGTPRLPADLVSHNCLLLSNFSALARWPFMTPEGLNRMQVSGRMTCDSADLLLDYAVRGFGIVRLGDMLVGDAIRRGDLVTLLEDHHVEEPYGIWAVMPPGRNRALRVRVFVDALAEAFKDSPWNIAKD
ncbi:LysR family transcriptional regulator [Terrarubrum flagellatum]|uniref:LysR family transcriptional regulator n=1 Tax=Terrirubrum flagellatum TaxID=2895980 RepID=UPI00314526B1